MPMCDWSSDVCSSDLTQSYPTLSDPMDCSLPGSSAHRIFQARVLGGAGDLRELPRVPLRGEGSCGGGGAPRCIYQRRQWQHTPVLLPGKSYGRRSLVGCSPWGREESDTTERLHFHFSLSCIGEGNSNPLQSSCLENSRDGGAWCTHVHEHQVEQAGAELFHMYPEHTWQATPLLFHLCSKVVHSKGPPGMGVSACHLQQCDLGMFLKESRALVSMIFFFEW